MSSVSSFCMFDKILYVMLVTDNINNMTKPLNTVKRKNENEFLKKNLTNLKRNQWNVTKRKQCMVRCLKLKYAI